MFSWHSWKMPPVFFYSLLIPLNLLLVRFYLQVRLQYTCRTKCLWFGDIFLAQICFCLFFYVLLIISFNALRPWKKTSSGWSMTSRERPMWGRFWPECYGWRSSWMKPIRPVHSSTMRTIQTVSQEDSGQRTLTTGATRGSSLSQQVFKISRLSNSSPL